MTSIFIADLHLSENTPQVTETFTRFITEYASRAKALYILGDLFEVWIGDDNKTAFNNRIIKIIKQLSETGVRIYFMHGNRDFLIGKRFCKAAGCRLLTDPTCINLYGTPVLLTHGDLLCAQDTEYQTYRKKIRSRFAHFLFLLKSLKKRQVIAEKHRENSKARNSSLGRSNIQICQNTVVQLLKKFQAQYLIHGHIHKPNIYSFNTHTPMTRISLGDWQNNSGSILICTPNENNKPLHFELRSFHKDDELQ